jgi:tRNA (adenine22-N1)-methyltransferase
MFSKRIIELADLVPMKSTVVDVGCDHALLDIYLTSNRRCKCTASDINPKCLKSANENIKKFGLENKIKVVESDGLKNIKYNNTDIIVIAGMGTSTILDILKDNHADNIIIQSNKDLVTLRESLLDDFIVEDERIVKERGIYYVLMKLKRGNKNYNNADYLIGPIIKDKNDGLYLEYKKMLYIKYKNIYDNIKNLQLNKRIEIKRILKTIKKYC